MAEVSIYVAGITAAAGVAGAALPQGFILIRDARRAKRDREDRQAAQWRQACLELLGAAAELRTRVANNLHYHGSEMKERLAKIRECAAEAQLHATNVSMLDREQLAEPAGQLAAAANDLAETAAQKTDEGQREMTELPSFAVLDDCVKTFRRAAVAGPQS